METSQEDMKLLGVFGICRESHKIMSPWRKIFNQIALAFILPCSIFLAQTRTSKIQISRIQDQGYWGEYTYTSPDRVVHIRLNVAHFAFPFICSLLSTSAVVYTIACIYANRDVSFKKVVSILPQVCIRKRLIITFIVTYLLIFLYMAVTGGALAFCLRINGGIASLFLSFIVLIGWIVGFVYITTVLQLASVVTILEESHGVEAMKRSRNLTKGKFRVVLSISFILNVVVWTIHFVFYNFVSQGIALGMWRRAIVGFVCLAVLVTVYLYGLVLQTITYFVCKSYHNEIIDKATLSQHLGEYEGRFYDPNAVQLKQIYSVALIRAVETINIVLDKLLNMY
ncbi:hypothetical protein POM88_045834 [Heracleum sosnowskyi]|uniref:Uncharacterized protein n=1 Tax=Heracleum sosnowskyi TaxID=360622 RepID=A0AAD8H858_9APIA|nr:hypothetical protein POM88_045834 [Heracleum sosnowskyi]